MRNRVNLSGLFSLLVVGGYYLWRNRETVQSFLRDRGIEVPENLKSIGGRISSRTGMRGEHEAVSTPSRRRATG